MMDDLNGYWFIVYNTYDKGVHVNIINVVYHGTMGEWFLERLSEVGNEFSILNQFQLTEEEANEIVKKWELDK